PYGGMWKERSAMESQNQHQKQRPFTTEDTENTEKIGSSGHRDISPQPASPSFPQRARNGWGPQERRGPGTPDISPQPAQERRGPGTADISPQPAQERRGPGTPDIGPSENQNPRQMNAEGRERVKERAEALVRKIGEACDELE